MNQNSDAGEFNKKGKLFRTITDILVDYSHALVVLVT